MIKRRLTRPRPRPRPRRSDSEFSIQCYVATEAHRLGLLFHGDPLGLLGNARLGGKAKLAGARKGWPDLCFIGGWGIRYFELKAADGAISPEQGAVHSAMRDAGVSVQVVFAATGAEAWEKIRRELGV